MFGEYYNFIFSVYLYAELYINTIIENFKINIDT